MEDFVGSSCENVDFVVGRGGARGAPGGRPAPGQRNELLRGQPDRAHAQGREGGDGLVEKVKTNLEECKKRRLTATVSDPKKVSGVGTRRAPRSPGHTVMVEQKGTQGSDEFRVGIVQAGRKVAYTFAEPEGRAPTPPTPNWNTISVRAGAKRATQVP